MNLPKELLNDLYWAFYQKFESQEEFQEELIKYNDVPSRRLPPLDRIAIPVQKVVIQYLWIPMVDEEDSEEDDEDRQFVITTENPIGFTIVELMFRINQGACTSTKGSNYDVSDQDHHFFEGLEYLTDDDPDFPNVPVYYMILGS
ncbi:MAG: hypothetical protein WBG46_03035 [Nonlabens sp.]